ncbi:HNH endonuclease [Natronococcus roseus]|uniref:HNH endonuclease n=1 Tax=Natronococcus roseus TaxID=1052014 RepID=UPI00374CBE5A
MTDFRSPRRRSVRQRSGFSVTEETSGGECKIKHSARFSPNSKEITLKFSEQDTEIPELFQDSVGLASFGGYVSASTELTAHIEITSDVNDEIRSENSTEEIEPGEWTPIGVHLDVPLDPSQEHFGNLEAALQMESDSEIDWIDFFGINLSAIAWEDFVDDIEYEDGLTIQDKFHQRTSLTVPYLYYLNHEVPFPSSPARGADEFDEGQHTFLKSCNRCARFLPTEYIPEKERNLTSFGNHCVSRAPCNHSTFGMLEVIEDESNLSDLPAELEDKITFESGSRFIDLHYGYQLECKACKKFYVNGALNHRRNSTQHREDALRRRAIEVLVRKLLDQKWIYHEFRQDRDEEFDKYIWEKFDEKCFKCGEFLQSPSEMDLDHTIPLAALWPLDEHATCLCSDCNSRKSDQYPVDFYTRSELEELAEITGLSQKELKKRSINVDAVRKLRKDIEWFFEDFLDNDEYQKDRDGKIVADLIVQSIQDRIDESEVDLNLVEHYQRQTGQLPSTVSIS